MELLSRPRGFSFPLVPALAAASAAGFATIVATLPAPLLDALVLASGLPAFVAMAEPPLGLTARALLFVGVTALGSILGILALYPILGTRRLRVLPVERRRPRAAPGAPRPISAHEELGAPFLSVKAGDRARQAEAADPGRPLPSPFIADEAEAAPPVAAGDGDWMRDDAAPAIDAPAIATPVIEAPAAEVPAADAAVEPAAIVQPEPAPAAAPVEAPAPAPTRASILLGGEAEGTAAPARPSIVDSLPAFTRRPAAVREGEDLLSMVGRLERDLSDTAMPAARGISVDEAAHVRAILDGLRPRRAAR